MITTRVLLLCLLFVCISTNAQQRRNAPAQVVTQPVKISPIEITVETVGTAEARKSVSLFPAAADRVTNVMFSPGDFVEQGDILLTLDDRRQKTSLQKAQIQLADAERTLKRLIKSKKDGAVTQSAVDDALTIRDLAKVAIVEAQADLDDRHVVAPFSGYVGLTDVEPGDRISISTLITTIDDRETLFINFVLPESALGLVKENTRIEVNPWNNREALMTATLAELDSRIDTKDRTLKVRAVLDNKDDFLRPGLSFKVKLSAAGTQYPLIPEAALAWGATGSYVWVSREGKADKVPVSIKQRLRGTILVEGQLNSGESLVVEGIQQLRQGQALQVNSLLSENK